MVVGVDDSCQVATDGTDSSEMPDAYHDKIREQPYPKADNELYLNPAPLIVPQAMKTGVKLQFSLSRSLKEYTEILLPKVVVEDMIFLNAALLRIVVTQYTH